MSTQNNTIENINISNSNVSGNCDLKCSYSFKYTQSGSTAKNNGIMISLSYDSSSVPPVIFNEQKYIVGEILILCPSIHTFDYSSMPGEIIIVHTPEMGGNQLSVCIPFTSSSESSNASQIITEIIQTVASNAPSQGDSTNLNMNFSLQDIIPKKPYYYYQEDNTNNNFIVFGTNYAIPLSSSTLSTLQKIITPFSILTQGRSLFYNAKGPISGVKVGDGIYISCKPTGSTKDEVAVEYNNLPTSAVDISSIIQNPIFKIIIMIFIGMLLFIIVFYGISIFYNYLSSDPINVSNVSKKS
jgi:hypothetical protein